MTSLLPSQPPWRVFIVAAEPSGDLIGAELVQAVREQAPNTVFAGMGGAAMAAQGIVSCTSMDGLSILGLTEALKIAGLVKKRVREVGAAIVDFNPDVVVLIDSWGFTIRVAEYVRTLRPDIKLVKMIGPQVFATRPGRAKSVARAYDALFCIHDFEVPFYDGLDLPITIIGNPAVARAQRGDGAGFRNRHDLTDKTLMLLLPGSRRGEIDLVSPTFEAAAQALCARHTNVVVVTVLAGAVREQVANRARNWTFPHLLVDETQKQDAFEAADLALACSGTVTTELALAGTPMVAGYRLGAVTAFIMLNFMMKSRFITLVNIALDQAIVPELLQDQFTPEAVIREAELLLTNPAAHARQVALLEQAVIKMGKDEPPMAQRAAHALIALLSAQVQKA